MIPDASGPDDGAPSDPAASAAAFDAATTAAVASGHPDAIRGIYKQLGEVLEEVTGDDLDSVRPLSWPETAPVVAAALGRPRGIVLDAGCGPWPICASSHWRMDQPVVGVDLGLGTLRLARAVCRRESAAILPVVADLQALPFCKGAFGGAVCDDTIEHVPDDAQAVTELARVIADGGRLVVATPNRRRPDVIWRKMRDRARGRARPGREYFAVASHLREYTWRDLGRLVEADFSVTGRYTVGWMALNAKRRAMTRLLAVPLVGLHLSRGLVIAAEPRPLRGTG